VDDPGEPVDDGVADRHEPVHPAGGEAGDEHLQRQAHRAILTEAPASAARRVRILPTGDACRPDDGLNLHQPVPISEGIMQQVPSHPVHIAPGDDVQLSAGKVSVMTLVENAGEQLQLRVRGTDVRPDGEVVVRWIDARGDAWRATASATPGHDPAIVVVSTVGDWELDAMRASQRISGNRHSMRGEVQAGSLAPGVRFDFVVLDVSASGCRASGVGRQPQAGDLIRLALQHPYEDERWQLARVMRITPLAFGRFEVGLRFEIESAAERLSLAGWRDAWAALMDASFDEPGSAQGARETATDAVIEADQAA